MAVAFPKWNRITLRRGDASVVIDNVEGARVRGAPNGCDLLRVSPGQRDACLALGGRVDVLVQIPTTGLKYAATISSGGDDEVCLEWAGQPERVPKLGLCVTG